MYTHEGDSQTGDKISYDGYGESEFPAIFGEIYYKKNT
jgi:hypothetical protein